MTIRTELLSITGMGFPPYSLRRAVQSLVPIEAASRLRRTVNGDLVDVSDELFQKFRSTITVTDQQAPEFVFPGAEVTVDCIQELCFKTASSSASRTIVPGSSRVVGDYTFYRPRLTMLIVGFTVEEDEWAASVSWSIDLEEK